MRKICLIAGLILLVSCATAHCFNITPTRIEISVMASSGYDNVIKIKNNEKSDLEFNLRTESWFKAVEGASNGKGSKLGWLEIKPLKFTLREGEETNVNFTVRVPKGARGELSAMIFVNGRPRDIKEGMIGINTSVGIPIYVMIKGTEKFKAEVEGLKVVTKSPLAMIIAIKNSGNVHIRPQGVIAINKKGNKEVMDVPLNEFNYPVLPDSSREIEIRSNYRLEKGEYAADIKMGYADRKYRKKITLRVE